MNWFFTRCPSCECNGHSTCSSVLNITQLIESPSDVSKYELKYSNSASSSAIYSPVASVCSECLNNTEGQFCSKCKDGFYGNAKNNGICTECDCGVQAKSCDSYNGKCFCNTKGNI